MTLRPSEQNDDTASILAGYVAAGFRIYATDDTIDFVQAHGIDAELMNYDTAQRWIMNHDTDSPDKISLVINVPTVANNKENESFPVRRKAIERRIPAFTCLDTARVFLKAVKLKQQGAQLEYKELAV